MSLGKATRLIQNCAQKMNARYGNIVFDEWAVVSLEENKGLLLSYSGPRKEGFVRNFLDDAGPLRRGLLSTEREAGDYEFERHGVGTGFEAYMVLGEGVYLICNNTGQCMDRITKNPQWLSAQIPFVELSDYVRFEPVSLQN
jgi:hypothetical protein